MIFAQMVPAAASESSADEPLLVIAEFSSTKPGRLALSMGHDEKAVSEAAFHGGKDWERLTLPLPVGVEGQQSLTLTWTGTSEEVLLRKLVVQSMTGKLLRHFDPETLLPSAETLARERRMVSDSIGKTVSCTFEMELPERPVIPPPPAAPPAATNWLLVTYLLSFLALGIVGTAVVISVWFSTNAGWALRIFGSLAWLLIFVGSFKLAGSLPITGVSLDDSWPLVLEYGAQRNWQLGSDLIYTFGPLGFLYDSRGLGGFNVERLIFAWGFAMFVAYVGWRIGCRLPWVLRIPFWMFMALFPSTPTLLAAGVACLLMDAPINSRLKRLEWLGLIAGCATLALVKFTDFLAISSVIAGLTTLHVVQRRWRLAVALPAIFGALHLVGWMFTGQSLNGFPSYLLGAWQISAGYSATMAYPPSAGMLEWGLGLAAALLFCAAIHGLMAGSRWIESCLKSVIVLGCAFLSWKHAFVRADAGHTIFFVVTAFPYSCLLTTISQIGNGGSRLKVSSWHSVLRASPALIVLAVTIAASHQTPNLYVHAGQSLKSGVERIVESPSAKLPQLKEIPTEQWNNWRLPQIASVVRNAKVDIVNFQQNYALLNGLNYRPRPVFQSYSSYTPYLHQVNLDYYRSTSRPDYLLFQLESIDARHPWLDDAPLMLDLLTKWTPRLREKGFLLLEPPPLDIPQGTWREIHSGKARWGRNIELPSQPPHTLIALRVDAPRSSLGKLKGFLYQPSLTQLTLQMQDGRKVTRRFIPTMATTGVQLSPYLETIDDLLSWQANLGGKKNEVVAFRLTPEKKAADEYKSDFRYTLLQWTPPEARTTSELTASKILYPYFPGIPEVMDVKGNFQIGLLDGMEACSSRTPTRFVFHVPAGARGVTGRFAAVCAPSEVPEEVTFTIHLLNEQGEKEISHVQTVIPQTHQLDHKPHFFDLDFPASSPDAKPRLILESTSTKSRLSAQVWWGPVSWKTAK